VTQSSSTSALKICNFKRLISNIPSLMGWESKTKKMTFEPTSRLIWKDVISHTVFFGDVIFDTFDFADVALLIVG
jgi:hypothetical protein